MRDPIERQDAIDALQKEIDKWTPPFDHVIGSVRCGVRLARNIIEDLPSAQLEPQWIPCSKGLPEKQGIYTVTDSKGDVVRFVFYNNESSREYWKRCAKAWMPLPEPWEGGAE